MDIVEVDGAVSKGHVSDGVLTCWAINVSDIVDRWVPYEASQQEELMKFHTQTTQVDRTIVIIYLLVFPCFFPSTRVLSIGYALNFTTNQLRKSKILSDMLREYWVYRVLVRRESTVERNTKV